MKIVEIEIHPGHWRATNSGASGILNEVTESRKVAKKVLELLKDSGVPCTYYEDNVSTNQRDNINTLIKEHNKDKNGLVVSIHFNSSGTTTNKAIGTEVLYYSEKILATKIAKAISDATGGGLLNRGAKQRTDLGVLAKTYEPAVLIEVCFVNSSVDAAIYRRDFEQICMAIAKELAAYLGKNINLTQFDKDVETLLTSTGRNEIRTLLKKARTKTYIPTGGTKAKSLIDPAIHTDEKIDKYSDAELLSYQAAVINRTFK